MKHSIKVDLAKGNHDLRPIRLRVSFCGCRVDLSLSESYNLSKWNADLERAKNNTRNDNRQTAAEINKAINFAVDLVDKYFNDCEIRNTAPNAETLRAAFCRRVLPETHKTLVEYYDEFMSETETLKSWSVNTYKKYKTLRSWVSELNGSDVEKSLQRIINAEISDGKKNSTITKNVKIMKVFLRWLKNKEYADFNLDTFDLRLKGAYGNNSAIIYLEYDELMALYNFDFTKQPSLDNTRDVFCFCCFSGLRFSDVKRLQKSDITDDCINIVTQKTSEPLQIELNQYTRAILDKYKDCDDRLALHVVSNQKYNDHIKDCCRLAGINKPVRLVSFSGSNRVETVHEKWEVVSSHCARRTFVVECLRRGIPAEVIMKWTGHSDYKAMQPYVAIVDTLKKTSMQKFDQ